MARTVGTLALRSLLLTLLFISSVKPSLSGLAQADPNQPIKIGSPSSIGGATGYNDARDVDIYPRIAYDSELEQHLVIWLTARNATSSTAGLDVYGRFLDQTGAPTGAEFRISDSNTGARSSLPSITSGNGEFVVAWTVRGSPCQIHMQRVINQQNVADSRVPTDTSSQHSPALTYNQGRALFAIAYVDGDDYLSPTLMGASTADCGNNQESNSQIQLAEFSVSENSVLFHDTLTVTQNGNGSFRPDIQYGQMQDNYQVVWEDRRDAGQDAFRFDLYMQTITNTVSALSGIEITGARAITRTGGNLALDTGINYANLDESSTWTPRPAIARNGSQTLVTWFAHATSQLPHIWSAQGRFYEGGMLSQPFSIMQMSYVEEHNGNAPTGFLSAISPVGEQEYYVAMTSHLETIWGYFSSLQFQRLDTNGKLLAMDGSEQSRASSGEPLDYDTTGQLSVDIVAAGGSQLTNAFIVYSKHPVGRSNQDFDIWRTQIDQRKPAPTETPTQTPIPASPTVPVSTPTATALPPTATTATHTVTLAPTPTFTATPLSTPTLMPSPTPIVATSTAISKKAHTFLPFIQTISGR